MSVWKLGQHVVCSAIIRNLGLHLYAFLAGVLGGVVGVLPDLDHPLSLLFGLGDPRFLHQWIFIISCVALFACCAFFGGLLYRFVLKHNVS